MTDDTSFQSDEPDVTDARTAAGPVDTTPAAAADTNGEELTGDGTGQALPPIGEGNVEHFTDAEANPSQR